MQTLLIADSNDAFRQQLAESFQPYYHVLTCRNGLEALDILCREHAYRLCSGNSGAFLDR